MQLPLLYPWLLLLLALRLLVLVVVLRELLSALLLLPVLPSRPVLRLLVTVTY